MGCANAQLIHSSLIIQELGSDRKLSAAVSSRTSFKFVGFSGSAVLQKVCREMFDKHKVVL